MDGMARCGINVRSIQEQVSEAPDNMPLLLQLIMRQNISLAKKDEFNSALAAYEKKNLENHINQMSIDFNSKLLAFEAKQKEEWSKEITRYIEENNNAQKEEISKAISEFTVTNNLKLEELIKQTNMETKQTLENTIKNNQDKLFEQINIRINQTEEQFAENARRDWEITKSQLNATNNEIEKAKIYLDQLQNQCEDLKNKQSTLNDKYLKDIRESKELIQQEVSKNTESWKKYSESMMKK